MRFLDRLFSFSDESEERFGCRAPQKNIYTIWIHAEAAAAAMELDFVELLN